MFEAVNEKLPTSFSSEKNAERRVQALVTEAFHLEAVAKRAELSARDTIRAEQKTLIQEQRAQAEALYSEAIALQTKHHNSLSSWQKAKPHIINAIIVTVIAAEIISIPILLANIYMMCKKHHQPANT